MHPKLRVEKRHPDGTPRAVWEAYRIEDHDGAVRLWTPAGTPLNHVNGHWIRPSASVTAWRSGDPFVISYFEDPQGFGLYIDIVREVRVTDGLFVYVDLYVDVLSYQGTVSTKDEDLLAKLGADEAAAVLVARDALVPRVAAGESPFRTDDDLWRVSDGVRALPPGTELELS